MDILIPAAGLASRMNGLPKFMLPCDINGTSLLEYHLKNIYELNNKVENIWIGTRKEWIPLIKNLNFVNIVTLETETMNETILELITRSNSNFFQMIMPDTYYKGEQPYNVLDSEPQFCELALWKIRDEQRGKLGEVRIDDNGMLLEIIDKNPKTNFKYSWGSLTFSDKFVKYIKKCDSHLGISVELALKNNQLATTKIINGDYFDCGTYQEYYDLISKI